MSLHNDSVHRGDWIASESFCYWLAPVTELAGKTLGIVGYGNIGRRVAEVAKACRMKDGVILINVSRGGLVDESDLAEALSSGKVAAAAVDVVSSEPMKADNPLLGAPNLMITPHMAWASVEARTRLVQTVADNCRSWLEGKGQNVL